MADADPVMDSCRSYLLPQPHAVSLLSDKQQKASSNSCPSDHYEKKGYAMKSSLLFEVCSTTESSAQPWGFTSFHVGPVCPLKQKLYCLASFKSFHELLWISSVLHLQDALRPDIFMCLGFLLAI